MWGGELSDPSEPCKPYFEFFCFFISSPLFRAKTRYQSSHLGGLNSWGPLTTPSNVRFAPADLKSVVRKSKVPVLATFRWIVESKPVLFWTKTAMTPLFIATRAPLRTKLPALAPNSILANAVSPPKSDLWR
jgi:hypothetical protein